MERKTDGANITDYVYSSRGELLSVTFRDGTLIEYVHDPLGRRIAKKINGSIVEKYLWQGLTRLLAVYDGSDSLLMRFEYADGRMPVTMTSGGSINYLTYDQVGSLRLVADSAGSVIKSVVYDSFGNIISDSNPTFAVPFGFGGGLHDRDTGLVRFGFRDYDPDIGRWTAKDPIFFDGGDTDLYGYVLNDPINLVDPDGLKGGILIPIRRFIKNNISGGDIIAPIIGKVLSVPVSVPGILAFDFLNPSEAGIGDENYLIHQWVKDHYPDINDFNIELPSVVDTLKVPIDDVVIEDKNKGGEKEPSKILKILVFWTIFIFIIFIGKKIMGFPKDNPDFIVKNLLSFVCTIILSGTMLHFLSVKLLKLSIPIIWILTILLITV